MFLESHTHGHSGAGIDGGSKKAKRSLVFGVLGLFAWLLPILGLPITIVGLVSGTQGLSSTKKTFAIVGITLSIIGLVLTIINASIGAYMGATGQLHI